MGSLEDLRDSYKSNRTARYAKAKANGATYSNKFNNALHKYGNTIVKSATGKVTDTDLDEKYSLNSSKIEFSLNKKGRWRIAGDLKSEMSQFEKDDLDVRVYEARNRIKNNRNNCIGVTKSKGGKIQPKSTYANLSSIISNDNLEKQRRNEEKKKNNKNKKPSLKNDKIVIDVENEVGDFGEGEEDSTDHIAYKIEYAARYDVLKYGSLFDYNTKDAVISRRTKNVLGDELSAVHRRHSLDLDNFDDDCESGLLDEFDVDEDLEEIYNGRNISHQFTLAELIDASAKAAAAVSKSTQLNEINEEATPARKLIHFTRQLSMKNKVNDKFNYPKVPEHKQVSGVKMIDVHFTKESIESNKLKSEFGVNYCEAYNALPRTLTINITKDIMQKLGENNANSIIERYEIKAWLLIKEKNMGESTDQNQQQQQVTCTVGILNNMKLDVDLLDCLKNDDGETRSLDKFYAELIKLIGLTPLTKLIKVKETAAAAAASTALSNPNKLSILANKHICKEMDELKSELIQSTIDKYDDAEEGSVGDVDDELIVDEIEVNKQLESILAERKGTCCLCFDEGIDIGDCTILKNCSHVFCDSCMRNYIDSHLSNRLLSHGKLWCPGCDNEVDLALVIYFASDIDHLEGYMTDCIEKVLFVLNGYKWCVNPKCTKAIKVDLKSTPYGIVSCDCGHQACLKCNMAPHFPAKCSQVAKYYNELKAKNEPNVNKMPEVYVGLGKRCPKPSCNAFMEKNGGCNQMKCLMCNTQFCWNCCKTWEDHLKLNNGEHACKIKNVNKNEVTVEFKKNDRPIKLKEIESFYENSLYHRRQRCNSNYKERVETMKRIMSSFKVEKELKNENEMQNYNKLNLIDQCRFDTQKRNEIKSFVNRIHSFLNEMHFVCEHTYVLLQESQIERGLRQTITNIVKSMEMIIWRMRYILSDSKGNKAVDELHLLMNKGINCLDKMSNLKI